MLEDRSVSVCMSAYNEQQSVAETVRDCGRVLDGIPGLHTILVVNDGSTDRTGDILESLAREESRLRILVHPENRGIARALAWLIEEVRSDVMFYIAADGQWRADELNGMLRKYDEGYDIVIGVRRKKQYSWYRLIVSWCYNALVRILFGKNFHDLGSIILARTAVWKRIPARSTSAFFVAEKVLVAYRNGARIGFTAVDHVQRVGGKSKFNSPLRALEACREVIGFWLSPRSRTRADLFGEEIGGKVYPAGVS